MTVSIGNVVSVADGVRYFEEAVAHQQVDYYAGRGEAPGVWLGPGADRLGLRGEVQRDDLVSVLEGRHPLTGDELGRHHGQVRDVLVAFDAQALNKREQRRQLGQSPSHELVHYVADDRGHEDVVQRRFLVSVCAPVLDPFWRRGEGGHCLGEEVGNLPSGDHCRRAARARCQAPIPPADPAHSAPTWTRGSVRDQRTKTMKRIDAPISPAKVARRSHSRRVQYLTESTKMSLGAACRALSIDLSEPPRESWRLHSLRGWSDDTTQPTPP